MRRSVDTERPDRDGLRARHGVASASKGADASDQHHEAEGLGEVVVGAQVETFGDVVLAVLRGEHQDRRRHRLGSQRAADLVAVDARQHDVEHDHVVRVLPSAPQPVDTICSDVDPEAFGDQATLDSIGHRLVVLDHQDPAPTQYRRRSMRSR